MKRSPYVRPEPVHAVVKYSKSTMAPAVNACVKLGVGNEKSFRCQRSFTPHHAA
jgi:hypothetical protein